MKTLAVQHICAGTLASALAISLLVGCGRASGAARPAPTQPTIVPTVRVKAANLSNQLVLTAEFTPYQDVAVMAKVAGYVQQIRVDIGDHVHKGELLATLEVPELQDEMARAKAGVVASQANILTARGAVERARAASDIALLSFQRIQQVSSKNPGLVPLQEVDVAQSRDLEARAQLASANSGLAAAQQAQQEAQSELQRAQAMLAYASIRAPFDGVVTKRFANTGSMIQAGTASQTQAMPIIELAQNDLLRLTFPVPVTDAAQIRDGEPVSVNVTTLNRVFPGRITRYADMLQSATRTMDTEVDVPNPKGVLIPGMYAEVHLHVTAAADALSVPLDAIEGLGSNSESAYVVRNGSTQVVPVTTGIQTPTRVQVLSGLASGEIVVVGRHSNLTAGEPVTPQSADYE